MIYRPILIVTCLFGYLSMTAQANDDAIRQTVLSKNIVNKEYTFGKWNENGGTETHLKYLGTVKTKAGEKFKIITSSLHWGLSHHATSKILIYTASNKYYGRYPVYGLTDLPEKLENGFLIFTNIDERDCDKNIITKVDFRNELPKEFFITCKGKDGDLYYFTFEDN